ncbi:MAG: ABC transporter permease [Caldilineaceae bacterium]
MTVSTANSASTIKPKKSRLNRFDSPWLNPKLLTGLVMVGVIVLLTFIGPYIYNTKLAFTGSSPQNLPPVWGKSNIALGFGEPSWDHVLGTESNGRDMLAVLIVGSPRSLRIGLLAAAFGVGIGIILGFTSGFVGGWVDAVIRTLSDSIITIPSLAVLIVIGSYVKQMTPETMAILLALLNWAQPTRLIRSQVLTLRERGYVQMARLSGASTFSIMFREILPNLLPYLASSFTGNVSGAILAATSLEVLGLGPTRLPTLGMTIYYAISAAAILRGMWWWWGIPILALVWIFGGLYQITIGLDEIANPRLRGAKPQ